jgi:hypothetical protein
MITASTKHGIIVDLYPKARPEIILVAAPVLQALARFNTG